MSESRLMTVLEASYPDLVRELLVIEEIIGNRRVDVLDALAISDEEAERVRAALRGGYGDIGAAAEDYDANAKVNRQRAAIQQQVHVTSILLRVLEFGIHLGRHRKMTLDDKPLRFRLEHIAQRERQKTKGDGAPG